jgi:hypothetical protein
MASLLSDCLHHNKLDDKYVTVACSCIMMGLPLTSQMHTVAAAGGGVLHLWFLKGLSLRKCMTAL